MLLTRNVPLFLCSVCFELWWLWTETARNIKLHGLSISIWWASSETWHVKFDSNHLIGRRSSNGKLWCSAVDNPSRSCTREWGGSGGAAGGWGTVTRHLVEDDQRWSGTGTLRCIHENDLLPLYPSTVVQLNTWTHSALGQRVVCCIQRFNHNSVADQGTCSSSQGKF